MQEWPPHKQEVDWGQCCVRAESFSSQPQKITGKQITLEVARASEGGVLGNNRLRLSPIPDDGHIPDV